ncbi:TPA: hypothetical protein SMQ69_003022, partial [Proteus mirabilis]|nr:hypothetical protein [Proteus mirabilis]
NGRGFYRRTLVLPQLSVRPTGAVDSAFRVGTQTEHFLYDAAANLLTRPHSEAPHNQVQGSDKFDYRYDGFGRMVSRYEKGSSSGQRYHYDSDHRIIAVDIDQGPLGISEGNTAMIS